MPRKDGARALDDRNRMTHMLWAAEEAMLFAKGKAREDLSRNRLLLRGIVHCIQEIGEAAARIADENRSRAPDIPWAKIVGMRHRIVHVYYNIDEDAVWAVVQDHLTPLVASLNSALKAWPAATGPTLPPTQPPSQG